METIETLIPDNEGNHLVVVLYFYDDDDKINSFQIPTEFSHVEIADININKINLDRPLKSRAFFRLCGWLIEQFLQYPNAIFSFICSTDPLDSRHQDIPPELYRWNLFEKLYERYRIKMVQLGVHSKDIIVGPEGFQTFAKVFYRGRHTPIIHLVTDHLSQKYS